MRRSNINIFGNSAQKFMGSAKGVSGSCGTACGTGDKDVKATSCGTACGTGDKEVKATSCGTACGAGDK